MDADLFLEFLLRALNHVDDQYYGIELWNEQMLNEWGIPESSKREDIKKYLSRYGERHFCYELYHHIRQRMESYYVGWPPEVRLYLQAELKKKQIKGVKEHFEKNAKIEALEKEYIPDYLLHGPGHFGNQEVVIEVKTDPKPSWTEIKEDFDKLQEFIDRYGYKLGVFLYVNVPPARIRQIITTEENSNQIKRDIPDRDRIILLQKENLEGELHKEMLSEIIG